jgi:hypothetical protein
MPLTNKSFSQMYRMVETADAALAAAQAIPRLLVELEMIAHQLAAVADYPLDSAGIDHRTSSSGGGPDAQKATPSPLRPAPAPAPEETPEDPMLSFLKGFKERPSRYRPLAYKEAALAVLGEALHLREAVAEAPAQKYDIKGIGQRVGQIAGELREHVTAAAAAFAQSTSGQPGGGEGGQFMQALNHTLEFVRKQFRLGERRFKRNFSLDKVRDSIRDAMIQADQAKGRPSMVVQDVMAHIADFAATVKNLSPGRGTGYLKVIISNKPFVLDPYDSDQHARMIRTARRLNAYDWKIQLAGSSRVEDSTTIDPAKEHEWLGAAEWLKERMRDPATRELAKKQAAKSTGGRHYLDMSPDERREMLNQQMGPVASRVGGGAPREGQPGQEDKPAPLPLKTQPSATGLQGDTDDVVDVGKLLQGVPDEAGRRAMALHRRRAGMAPQQGDEAY